MLSVPGTLPPEARPHDRGMFHATPAAPTVPPAWLRDGASATVDTAIVTSNAARTRQRGRCGQRGPCRTACHVPVTCQPGFESPQTSSNAGQVGMLVPMMPEASNSGSRTGLGEDSETTRYARTDNQHVSLAARGGTPHRDHPTVTRVSTYHTS